VPRLQSKLLDNFSLNLLQATLFNRIFSSNNPDKKHYYGYDKKDMNKRTDSINSDYSKNP